jgi:outer membrane biosynthesis protein TonB
MNVLPAAGRARRSARAAKPVEPGPHGVTRPAIKRILLCALGFALMAQRLCAQSADDFFHTGAQAYLTNNTTTAREQVDKGLKQYPNDIKLKKLDELLKQQQQQKNQQQQQQQKQQQQQNQSQQNQSQSKQDQQKQDQQKKDEQKKQDQQKQDQKDQQNKDQDKQDDKQQPKEQPTPGEMSPDEAKKLLDSQKSDEKLLPANQDKKHDRNRELKDW